MRLEVVRSRREGGREATGVDDGTLSMLVGTLIFPSARGGEAPWLLSLVRPRGGKGLKYYGKRWEIISGSQIVDAPPAPRIFSLALLGLLVQSTCRDTNVQYLVRG